MTIQQNIDINEISEALNDKIDRDLNNTINIIPQFILLYNGLVQKDNSITFYDDPANYDFLVGIYNNILTGKYFNNRVKLNGLWVGKDAYNAGSYHQTYSIDLEKTSANTYTCWSAAWCDLSTSTDNELQLSIKIFGVKL